MIWVYEITRPPSTCFGTNRIDVWSRHLMDRIEGEPFWFGGPLFADALVGREAFECLQSSPEVAGANEVDEVAP